MTINKTNVNSSAVTTLFVGFGPAAEAAARLMLRRGRAARSLNILAAGESDIGRALSIGLGAETSVFHQWSADHFGAELTRIIVDLGDDGVAERMVRIARTYVAGAVIIVNVCDPRSAERMIDGGASEAFCQASVAGRQLAGSVAITRPPDESVH